MTIRILSHRTISFSSFKAGPAAFPEFCIKASLVLLYSACPHARTLLPSLSHLTLGSICISGWVQGQNGKGQKASKFLTQELRDPEPFHVALERGLCPHVRFPPLWSQVLRSYNVMDMTNTTCQDLQIEVTVMGHVEYTSECWGHGLWVSEWVLPGLSHSAVPLQWRLRRTTRNTSMRTLQRGMTPRPTPGP